VLRGVNLGLAIVAGLVGALIGIWWYRTRHPEERP
jgi:hypothetical protein